MKILSLDTNKDNSQTINISNLKYSEKDRNFFDDLVEALESVVLKESSGNDDFVEFEQVLLKSANEACRHVLSAQLKRISQKYENEFLLIDAVRYKRHELGTVDYHSLCGSMKVARYTYRQTGVHNGPTVVPLDLAAGLMNRATPALAYRAALGDAQCPGRQWEEQLRASFREPPSRGTLERIAKGIGKTAEKIAPEILPIVRDKEKLDGDAVAVSVGLDRTTIPMEEKLGPNATPLKRRKKPYVRKPPDPVEVNYRMGYVGTVSVLGVDGQSVQTRKYGCSADKDPKNILKMMTDDLVHIQNQRKAAQLPQLPIGIIQDGAPEMWNLMEPAVQAALPGRKIYKGIDRYHLTERLAESLKALNDPDFTREVQLNIWRKDLEKNDNAIDKIEAFLKKHTNRLKKQDRLNATNTEIMRTHLTYIKNNKHYMRYASLRKNGLPTGSGATEGACKSLVMIRTKGCGQRWHSPNVNTVLTLRGLYMSQRLLPFWNCIQSYMTPDIKNAA